MVKLTDIAEKVFLDRYALRDKAGDLLEKTPEQMWRRVANGIAANEKKSAKGGSAYGGKNPQKYWEEKFYKVMEDFKFVPGGRILSGAGTGYQVTYFNCFVIPSPKDSREGILDSLKQLVEIQSRSGGVGLNLSSLRPRGARVRKVNGTSSGPVTWAGLFSYATHDVVQQGGTRRGATMLMLWDWHPDIEEFITVKQDLSKINGANLSVCVSDAFMQAVKADRDWDLVYPDIDDPSYDSLWDGDLEGWKKRGGRVKVHKTVKASYLWNLICEAAWRSAEPGLHFLERSNTRSNTWYFENLIATNPCGEQPLGAWAVCNLGAMNLSSYVKGDDLTTDTPGKFDFDNFGQDVQVAMRLLDNVIDQTYYFFSENEKCAKDIRRTGLGIMGLGDALIKMKIRYGSEKSLPVIEKIFKTLRDNAYEASVAIAEEKGAFPKYERDKYLQGYHIQNLPKGLQKKIEKHGIRNAVLLTIAPTGTTSLVAGVTSGIEPVYEFVFKRRWRGGEQTMYHPLFEMWKKTHPSASSGQVPSSQSSFPREASGQAGQVTSGESSGRPDYFVSANDLTPLDHARVQAVAQEYIDSSISKTVNAPNSHTVEDVKTLYMAAYDMGLKGVTYMRDGSRQGVLERVEPKKEEVEQKKADVVKQPVLRRPMMVQGYTYETKTPFGNAFITINHDAHGDPFELFITIGKSGSDVAGMAEALGRMISLSLRMQSGVPPRERMRQVVGQLSGIGGVRAIGFGENRVRSLPDAIAKVLAQHFEFVVNGVVKDIHKKQEIAGQMGLVNNGQVLNGNGVASYDNGLNGSSDVKLSTAGVSQEPAVAQQAAASIQMHLSSATKFDMCPSCGGATLAFEEGCKKCYGCGYSEC